MTDLERFQGARDDALVKTFSRRVEPTYGFVIYGVVWFFLSSFAGVAGGLLGGLICKGLGLTNESTANGVIVFALAIVAWAAAWIPFVRWARRKRSNARSLVREGVLCDAKVATSTTDRAAQIAVRLAMAAAGSAPGVTWERVVFDYKGKPHAAVAPFNSRPAQGAPCHVLFHPLAKYALAFSPEGRAFATKAHQV